MASGHKYVNLNPFPITLPTQSGGRRTFRPGEWAAEQWWSRFQGFKQLKQTLLTPDEITAARAKMSPQASPLPAVTPMKIDTPPAWVASASVERTGENFEFKLGIYKCTICRRFAGGTQKLVEDHIKREHPEMVGKSIPVVKSIGPGAKAVAAEAAAAGVTGELVEDTTPPPLVEQEPLPPTSELNAGQLDNMTDGQLVAGALIKRPPTGERSTVVPIVASEVPTPGEEPVDAPGETSTETFPCTVCDRVFKAQGWLDNHMKNAHGPKTEA